MTGDIEITREGAVLSAAFARPEKVNAITSAVYEALIDVLEGSPSCPPPRARPARPLPVSRHTGPRAPRQAAPFL